MQDLSAVSSKKHFSSWILFLVIIVVSGVLLIPTLSPTLSRNVINLRLLNLLRNPVADRIRPLSNLTLNDCEALWLSHVIAAIDLEMAEDILNDAKDCPNREAYYFWAGEIALKQGSIANAKYAWKELKPGVLILWGFNEYHFGSKNKARVILETVLDYGDLSRITEDQYSNLYSTLALFYKETGDIQKSIEYYRKAWENGGHPYPIAYELGSAYFAAGITDEAIEILEHGLLYKRKDTFYTQLDFGYYLRLAECYAQLGNSQRAMDYYLISKNLINQEINYGTTDDVIRLLQDRLDRIKYAIERIH